MKIFIYFFFLISFTTNSFTQSVVFSKDNGSPGGNFYSENRKWFEESVRLIPDGPCNIDSLQIYFAGDEPTVDTIRIIWYPNSGNLFPTQYVWDFNTVIDPIIYEYDGKPGWKTIDLVGKGLRSDGYDKLAVQHRLRPQGPWFMYDDDGRQNLSWGLDPFTPNPNFYNIQGTIATYPPGDYMVRFVLRYDYPDGNTSLPPPPPTMLKVNDIAGLNRTGYTSVVDWNNDGMDDLEIGARFFENIGNGKFREVTDNIGLAGNNTTWGDVDNDGLIDCFVGNGWTNDKLYKNNGDGTFADITEGTNIINNHPSDTPILFDYDNNGLLDLFIANRRSTENGQEIFHPDQLFKNLGDGTFENVTQSAGISAGEPGGYDCYGAQAVDYNYDNKMDIFVANYRLIKDNLYMNNGNGTFTEVAAETGVQGEPTASPQYFGHGMGCEWADFNNDGYIDLCVGNLGHTDSRGQYSNPSLIYMNSGPPVYNFSEVHKQMGLKFHEGNAGVCWLDLDLDGYQDLWHGKYDGGIGALYLNTGPPDYRLKDITWVSGCVQDKPWVAVRTDYDLDGDLDLIAQGNLFRNDMPRKGMWLALRLSGSPENNVNMDAYGSKVTVYCGENKFYRELGGSAAGSRTSQNSNEIFFGIGMVEGIDSVVVIYSNGQKNLITGIKPNARYRIAYMQQPVAMKISAPALMYPTNMSHFQEGQTVNIRVYKPSQAVATIIRINDRENVQVYRDSLYFNESNRDIYIVEANSIRFVNGKYTWNATAVYEDGSTANSSTWEFYGGYPTPSIPVLIYPDNELTDLSVTPLFKWNEVTYEFKYGVDTEYIIQLSNDSSSFDKRILHEFYTTGETELLSPDTLKPGRTYYWRVAAVNHDKNSGWSEIWNFTTMALPEIPILTEPVNYTVLNSLKPRFKWDKTVGAETYEIEVAADSIFQNIAYEKDGITLNRLTMLAKLDDSTDYWWHVRATNKGGKGDWSESWKFSTLLEVSVKELIKKTNFKVQPNPFNKEVRFIFEFNEPADIKLTVYDILGNEIAVPFSGKGLRGLNEITWEPQKAVNGVYTYRLQINNSVITGKIICSN